MPMPSPIRARRPRLSPPQIITLSFALLILAGSVLLSLPVATQSGAPTPYLDALFTATSAVCVTGLVTVNTLTHWSAFGKAVILLLIQVGGLGFMTLLATAMMLLRRRLTLRDRLVLRAAFNQEHAGGMVRLLQRIVRYTLCFEGLGALLLTLSFAAAGMPLREALPKGIFHAVSAFCNAGFDLIGAESLTPYRTHMPINLVVMALIVAGGLGFTVVDELWNTLRYQGPKPLRRRVGHLSLHTKLVLVTTAVLLLSGALLFLALEWNNPATLGPMPPGEKAGAATFQSVTLRTAGFNTIDQGSLTEASRFFACLYMVVGGSPAGTAGGLKTTTLAVILLAMRAALRGRRRNEAFGRTLPEDLLQKALTVTSAMFIVVLAAAIALTFTEAASGHSFLNLLFESCSAAGTVGITAGVTATLSPLGKLVLIVCMFLGRLSPVTVVVSLNMRSAAHSDNTAYIEESVIIG